MKRGNLPRRPALCVGLQRFCTTCITKFLSLRYVIVDSVDG